MHGASYVRTWVALFAGVGSTVFGLSLLMVGQRRRARHAGDRGSDASLQVAGGRPMAVLMTHSPCGASEQARVASLVQR